MPAEWTVSEMEKGETAALESMVPYVDWYAQTGAPVLERRQNVRLRSHLVRAAVESFMDGGKRVIVTVDGSTSVSVAVEPIRIISPDTGDEFDLR